MLDELAMDGLQKARAAYHPTLPLILKELALVHLTKVYDGPQKNQEIEALFPMTYGQPLLKGQKGKARQGKPLQVGVVFSGGQAAGGNNVVSGVFDALKQLDHASKIFGFLDGPGGIIAGKAKELTAGFLEAYRNQGGFDMIGSGRTKIETEEQLKQSMDTVQKMHLDGLVIIGGDDSNTNAAILAEYFLKNGCAAKVIGVPKTIDGDLKNAHVATSFGFDTACKIYSEIIGNIAKDAVSAKKYTHFIKLMGRSASHVTLECALATRPNMALIGEEVAEQKKTLSEITREIADLICKRSLHEKNFGVVLIPEGLIEFIPEVAVLIKELNQILLQEPTIAHSQVPTKLSSASQRCFASLPEKIQQQLMHSRDPHGNLQVSSIETELLLMETVTRELEERQKKGTFKGKFAFMHHFLGYEGRAGFPSNFDCNYCYALGATAALLIDQGMTGYMAAVLGLARPAQEWEIGAVPLTSLCQVEMRKGKEIPVIQRALVDLKGKPFTTFKQQRERWKLDDEYRVPGPIQFFGTSQMTDRVPLTLMLEST
jgi:pyrophosphate--fructose-6-phosphate 1-phosphotransferase